MLASVLVKHCIKGELFACVSGQVQDQVIIIDALDHDIVVVSQLVSLEGSTADSDLHAFST